MLTPSDLVATLGIGMTTEAAARMLRCAARTVRRAAIAYDIPLTPRRARLRGEAEWRAAYAKHGPSIMDVARALGMGHSYVHRQLDYHGIRLAPDPWVRLHQLKLTAMEMLKAGATLDATVRATGLSESTLIEHAYRTGVKAPRPQDEPAMSRLEWLERQEAAE